MSKHKPVEQNEKVVLPDNIMDLISEIVKDIDQVKNVVDDVHSGSWSKAVSDTLAVIGSIVNDLILPKVLSESQSKAEKPQ